MSGPSSTQIELQHEQAEFYKQGAAESRTTFAEDQDLLKQMEAVYKPILAKGPNQRGFSDEQRSSLNSQAVEGTARNYSQAARAVNENLATEGGDENPLQSGGEDQLREEVAMSAASEQSREQQQIVQADYAEGEHQFEHAGAELAAASGRLSPTSYENAATGAGSAAEKTASDIVSEENSWIAPVMGAIGAVGGGLAGNPALCPAEGSLILMADGSEKLVEDIVAGDQICGANGEKEPITYVVMGISPLLELQTRDGSKVVCSPSHTLISDDGFVLAFESFGRKIRTKRGWDYVTKVEMRGQGKVFDPRSAMHSYCANGIWALATGYKSADLYIETPRVVERLAELNKL
jgi:hypothetical protein